MDEQQPEYNYGTICRLVDGIVRVGIDSYAEIDGHWGDLRSHVERTGQIEAGGFVEVLDLENAISALRHDHPEAASVVICHLHGMTKGELSYIRNYERLLDRAKSYLLAYLNGEDPNVAYRKAGRKRRVA